MRTDWYCPELDDVLKKSKYEGIIIFGCGHDGKRCKVILENCNYYPICFCDSDKEKVGKIVNGLKVISVDELLERYMDCLVVLGSSKYMDDMYNLLLERNFPSKNIFYPKYKSVVAMRGCQYFDVFSPQENEIFIDAGCYDGGTIDDFMLWNGGRYKKILAFEPIDENYQRIKSKLKRERISRTEVFQSALWEKRKKLPFIKCESGSHITNGEENSCIVEGITLDEIVKGEEVTFIKMDVEGSELNALKGAKNTIMRNKPKLAICIYHKPEDILELPVYILDLVKEYKFYIRHYSSCIWETVLYAEYKE